MQALIITAYKNTKQLLYLIEETYKNFLVFIHVDRKTTSIDIEKIKEKRFPNVILISTYRVTWGGVKHLLAIRDLLELAVSDPRVTYIHIISGQDILLRDYSEFERFFSGSQKIYMTCTSMKDAPDDIKRRLENWIPFSNIDCRKKTVSYINDVFYSVQRFLHITRKRLGMFDDIYKGMVWCSFPVSVARYVIEYNATHKEFLNDLKHTQIPEEFFFQTIIMNSSYKENVVKRNLRYTDWSGKNGSNPSFLDETDYEAIIGSTSFFARKIDLVISEKLLNKIMRERQCS